MLHCVKPSEYIQIFYTTTWQQHVANINQIIIFSHQTHGDGITGTGELSRPILWK